MEEFKVLNLYACFGGNRYKWDEVAKANNFKLVVTAVEKDPELARLYQERFPNDIVIVGDAHQYLLEHYKEFYFIWSSPPCPTHSRARYWNSSNIDSTTRPVFPDMKLYEEIIFLKHYFTGKWCVENVVPFYTPLLPGFKRGRHLYWTNFNLPSVLSNRKWKDKDDVKALCDFHQCDFTKYKGTQRTNKIARNLVDYEAGKTILEAAITSIKGNYNQIGLFDQIEENAETH